MSNINATREQIVEALQQGWSVNRINRELRADRARIRAIRDELNLPVYIRPATTRTIDEKWREYAGPADTDGHMEWTGEHGTNSGTPLLSYKERHHSAAGIAFRIRTGRDPEGQVIADCGRKHCIAPDHVEDEPGRRRNREQLRYLLGGGPVPEQCKAGHKLAEHGRIGADGHAYCQTCKYGRTLAARQAVAA
ncbi:hypothetical protein [Streptomyces sp. L2]|uniref:hypothetical protein n=1 Tax=Streptomyces sp. L2 TaxID=2162665 RepID=UPI0010127FAF|nr:hypothetical protein [Streptomyces sp. L2]